MVNRDGCTRFCYSIIFASSIEYFLSRVKPNVRAKGRVVNSVFLVQLRKMMVTDHSGSTRIKELPEDILLNRVCGGDSSFGRAFGEGSVGVARRIVHRGRTGNAERQWSVGSGQWAVVSGQWSVASSCSRRCGEPRKQRFFAEQPRRLSLRGSAGYKVHGRVKEFSRGLSWGKMIASKGERSQLLGSGWRTVRSLLSLES